MLFDVVRTAYYLIGVIKAISGAVRDNGSENKAVVNVNIYIVGDSNSLKFVNNPKRENL